MTTHTEACQAAQAAFATTIEAYRAKFPNACLHCHGHGGKSYGATLETPPEYVDCEHCLGQLKCPGCGETHQVFADCADGAGPFAASPAPTLTCPLCDWTHDGSGAEPEPPGCCCYEDRDSSDCFPGWDDYPKSDEIVDF